MSNLEIGGSTGPVPRALLNRPVFFSSAVLIIGFALLGIVMPDASETFFGAIQDWVLDTFGWLYILAVAIFLVFCVGLAASPFGRVKLGPDDSEPDYSYASWFAMLFSAGMGIGLMFFGVAEPIFHFTSPPVGEGGSVQAARDAMMLTFFHWGFHAWAIYAVVGLSLAYFCFRRNLPLTIRSALYPLIGDRIHGPIGHVVDTLAVVGTLLGIATSLGLGVLQINAGLNHLFGLSETPVVQVGLIAVITVLATISVVTGLDAGIRRLSELNVGLALALLAFVILVGPTAFLLQALVQNTGSYFSQVVGRTFQLYAYEPNEWLGSWTLFYWAWWIAWSPFVGMFIARISRGRTIREFVVGVLAVPFVVTAIWFTAFGNTALGLELGGVTTAISQAANENTPLALFAFLEQLPLAGLTSVLATLLVITFFVTSSDSGSLVIDTITAGGRDDAPVWQRIFWALLEGAVAAALLVAGGLTGLQTASLLGALPLTVVLLFMCYGLYRGLMQERESRGRLVVPVRPAVGAEPVPWRKRLTSLLDYPDRDRVATFLAGTVEPALNDVAAELQARSVEARVDVGGGGLGLAVASGPAAFEYLVRGRAYDVPDFALRDLPRSEENRRRYYRAEVSRDDGAHYDIMDYTKEQVIADVLMHYERHLHGLQASAA